MNNNDIKETKDEEIEIIEDTKGQFEDTVQKNRKKSLEQMINQMNEEKLRVLQKVLEESNINYDSSIKNYHDLIKNLKKNLSKEQFANIENKCKEIDAGFEQLINDLSNKSTTAFDRFVEKLGKIIKPISIGLALNTAVKLAPTPVTKLAVMGVSTIYTGYNIVKNSKYKKIITKDGKLNQKLQDLEFVYDENKKLVDTRFSEKDQEIIRKKLKEMNVEFIDTGYQSLRSAVYSLDVDKKMEIVMALSGQTDKQKFEKELSKYKSKSFFQSKIVTPVLSVTASTLLVGLTGVVNGWAIGGTIENITDNSLLGKIAGGVTSLITLLNKNSTIIKAETLFIGTIISFVGNILLKIIKAIKNNRELKKLQSEYEKIENSKYADANNLESEKLKEILQNSDVTKNLGELAIIEIVTEYMRDYLEIDIKNTPKNIHELGSIIKTLKNSDRHKIKKLMNEFDYFNDKPNNQLKRKLEKIMKATGMTALLGLAGMSVVDIFTGGEFLNDVRDKLFFYDSSIGNYEIESALVLENEARDASKGIYLGNTVNIYKTTSEETTVNCYINTLLYDSKEFNFGGLDKHGLTPETYAQFTEEMSKLTLNDCNRLIAEGGIIPTLIDSTKESNLKEALTKVVLPYFTKRKQYLDSTFQLDAVGGVLTGVGTVSNIVKNLNEDKINNKK